MTAAHDPIAAASALRVRRMVFIVYATALAAGTHWPRLQLGDPANPPDKMLHFIAFGGLAVVMHEARFTRNYLVLATVGILWTAIDEITQMWPGLGRVFSLEDVAASAAGFLVATAILWSTRPRGGDATRLRRARFETSIDRILSRPVGLMAILSASALGVAFGMPLVELINRQSPNPTPFQARVIGAVLGSTTAAAIMLVCGVRSEEKRLIQRDIWKPLPTPVWPDVVRACALPIAAGFATLVAAFVAWSILGALGVRPIRSIHSLSKGMETVIDATVIGFIVAGVVENCRRRLARHVDEGDRRCLMCGHDLHATPVAEGWGRCSECGEYFWRGRDERAGSTGGE